MSYSRRDFVAAVAAAGITTGISRSVHAASEAAPEAGKNGDVPVYVIATILVKPGTRDELIRLFKANVPAVHAEDGCILYEPVIDMASGIGVQGPLREDAVVVMETWASLDHLLVHLDAPHMNTYRESVKDIVAGVDLQVLCPA